MHLRTAIVLMVVAVALMGARLTAAAELQDDAVEKCFFPYRAAKPVLPELPPGSVLTKDNWQRGADLLPSELLEKVKKGELQVRTQETTDLPVSQTYIDATRRFASAARLTEDGSLEGYVAGRPFPVIDPADQQAGVKMAWNDRYRDFGNSAEAWGTFRAIEQSGRVAREIEFYYAIAYGMHRDDPEANRWEKDGVLLKDFYKILAPFDMKNLMSVRHRHDDDRQTDVDWSYLPQTRKVRRLVVQPEEPTMGTELLHEDFWGFFGYIHAHRWKFLGRKTLLVPIGIKAANAAFTREGYPADAWEPRTTVILEATPENSAHPYGKRVLYIDEQMGVSTYVLIYNRQGEHYKTVFTVYANPAFSPGNEHVRVPVWLGDTAVNHTNGQSAITALSRVSFTTKLPEEVFDVDTLVEGGR